MEQVRSDVRCRHQPWALDRGKLLKKLGGKGGVDIEQSILLSCPAVLVRRGRELRLAIAPSEGAAPALADPTLVKLLVRAHEAHATLIAEGATMDRLRRNELARYARLKTLAPDIVTAIVEGRQPASLSARRLLRLPQLPLGWAEQRVALGFS